MKVIIDISPLQSVHKTRGIGIYTRNLIEALRQVDHENEYILTSKPQHVKANLIHYPFFDFFFATLPLFKSLPTVVTIHDTIPLIFPRQYRPGLRGSCKFLLQKLSLKSVAAIIADSHNSRRDIIKYLHVPKAKVQTVYLAANHQFRPAPLSRIQRVKIKYELPEKYCLYVGDINYNKNIPRLIEAFSYLRDKSIHLILVARSLENSHLLETKIILDTINHHNVSSLVHILTNIPLDPLMELIAIYSGASAYVQPSLYEGFGLPLLEAMQCHVPVVSSRAASLPEVGGQAVIYIDPTSRQSITHGLEQALNLDSTRKRQLISQGLEQAKKFSWTKTAQNTIKVYQQVLGS